MEWQCQHMRLMAAHKETLKNWLVNASLFCTCDVQTETTDPEVLPPYYIRITQHIHFYICIYKYIARALQWSMGTKKKKNSRIYVLNRNGETHFSVPFSTIPSVMRCKEASRAHFFSLPIVCLSSFSFSVLFVHGLGVLSSHQPDRITTSDTHHHSSVFLDAMRRPLAQRCKMKEKI